MPSLAPQITHNRTPARPDSRKHSRCNLIADMARRCQWMGRPDDQLTRNQTRIEMPEPARAINAAMEEHWERDRTIRTGWCGWNYCHPTTLQYAKRVSSWRS